MKQYPSINNPPINIPIFAFPKYDGQNLRVEWTKKHGFKKEKFGSRHVLIDENSNELGKFSIPILRTHFELLDQHLKYLEKKVFTGNELSEVVLFFEFFGPNSFAGLHDFEKDKDSFEVKLIDVALFGEQIMHPKTFKKYFSEKLPDLAAPCLYEGNANEEFLQTVKNGSLKGQTFEGVMCKGSPLKNGYPPYIFKVKSIQWINKVKERYADDEKKIKELL